MRFAIYGVFLFLFSWLLAIMAVTAIRAERIERLRDIVIRPPAATNPAANAKPSKSPIARFTQLSPNLYCGGVPHGEAAFAMIAAKGIKTILSVDGEAPEIETAKQFGLRYVHLPTSYAEIAPENIPLMVKMTKTLPGPYFVHCHKGKYRGPTAAAIVGIAAKELDRAAALALVDKAEDLSTRYPGLRQSVERFQMPDDVALAAITDELPEVTEATPTVSAMVAIGALFDRINANWTANRKLTADRALEVESRLLAEHFHELIRVGMPASPDEEYDEEMAAAEQIAWSMTEFFKNGTERSRGDGLIRAMEQSCVGCHAKFRDHAK